MARDTSHDCGNENEATIWLVDNNETIGGGFNIRPDDPKNPPWIRTLNDPEGKRAQRIARLLNSEIASARVRKRIFSGGA